MPSLNLIFKLKNDMSTADFFDICLLKVLLSEYEGKKIWRHLNTLKPGAESTKTETVLEPD